MSLADWMTPEFIRAFVSCYRNPRDARKFLHEVGVFPSAVPLTKTKRFRRRIKVKRLTNYKYQSN